MGCCSTAQDEEIQVKRGENFKYAVPLGAASNEQWVLTNEKALRTVKVESARESAAGTTELKGQARQKQYIFAAVSPGQETLLFAQYPEGSRDARQFRKVKVKIL